ncbi:MAG: alcohol dehydrogenase catalytic domain-containing protein [Chloroflexi bacterium]|nr:alcohol dehydrogenase catalytic domain-containing protein [Chloroflexota bacterium]
MRALVFDGQLRLATVPPPQPQTGQALLKLRRAGICNTDLELVAGLYHFTGILGHEFVAEVEQGPSHLIGQRVVGEINIGCGQCDFCQRGISSQCRNRSAVGIHQHPGAFADYLALSASNLHHVPDSISDDTAVFVEPLAAALQIMEGVHISPRDRIIVLGLGKLGMLAVQVLRLTGADVIGVVRHEKQSQLLSRWGITACTYQDLESERAQVVVDCTGQASGFSDALHLVEARGTIVLKSTYEGLPQVNLTQVAAREIRIVGSRCGPFEAALRLLQAGLVDVESLIEARYPFAAAPDAMQHAGQRGTLKVLLDF